MHRRALLSAAFLLMSATAEAHTGAGATTGFAHGFLHPTGGLDHVLVMVAVGLFAARLGGRALWLVPLSFVSMMAAGGAAGMAGLGLPFVEIGIALSVIALGAVIALGQHLPTVAAMALVGLFAILHGHAHGAEMPESFSGLSYAAGFVTATALLHVSGIGIGIGLLLGKTGTDRGDRVFRTAGGAMALAGLAILAGAV